MCQQRWFSGTRRSRLRRIDCSRLSALLASHRATVIDLALSPNYRTAHIPGAWFAIRSRLKSALQKIPVQGELVLTSEDGVLAGIAAADAAAHSGKPVRHLVGGNAAWHAAEQPMSNEPRMADEPVDVWLKPYERAGDTKAAMDEYLTWEVDLLPRIERDGTCTFRDAAPIVPTLAISRAPGVAANSGASFSISAGPKCACGFDASDVRQLPPADRDACAVECALHVRARPQAAIEEGVPEKGPLASGAHRTKDSWRPRR